MQELPVIISPRAQKDLENIADFIAEDNPDRALSFIEELEENCKALSRFPQRHIACPELGPDARSWPYKNYIILYRILQDSVSIERILYGARDLLPLLTPDSGNAS